MNYLACCGNPIHVRYFLNFYLELLFAPLPNPPKCPGRECQKTHPITEFKLVNSPNWPTRAFRMPDFRESPHMIICFRCKKIMKENLRKILNVINLI